MADSAGPSRAPPPSAPLLHLLLTLAGTGLVGGVAWWATAGFGAHQAQQEIARAWALHANPARCPARAASALSIEARLAADRSGVEFYLLEGPDGQRLAGNLSGVPRQPGLA